MSWPVRTAMTSACPDLTPRQPQSMGSRRAQWGNTSLQSGSSKRPTVTSAAGVNSRMCSRRHRVTHRCTQSTPHKSSSHCRTREGLTILPVVRIFLHRYQPRGDQIGHRACGAT